MKYPSLGADVIYTASPKLHGDPVGQDRAAKIVHLMGDGENANLLVFGPNGGITTKRNVPHHELGDNELPKPGTYRFPPKPIGG